MNLHELLKYWIEKYATITELEEMYCDDEIDTSTLIENMMQFIDESFISICTNLNLISNMEERIASMQEDLADVSILLEDD